MTREAADVARWDQLQAAARDAVACANAAYIRVAAALRYKIDAGWITRAQALAIIRTRWPTLTDAGAADILDRMGDQSPF